MAEQVRNLIAKWNATWPSPLVVSRQHDNGQFRINLVDYPEPENYEDQNEEILETINYYLVVWMKQSEDGEMEKLAPIQLPGPYWLVNSPYTQLVQDIKFQFYATSSVTGYIAHSAQFKGMILESLSGSQQQSVIPEEMWDAYKQYIEDKIIGAGLATIDPTLSISGAAADAKATGDKFIEVNGRLTYYPLAVNVTDGSYVVGSTGGIDTNANLSYAEVSVLAFRGKGITIQSYLWHGAGYAFLDVNGAYIYGESANTKGITPDAGVLTKVETSVPYNAYSLRVTLHQQTYAANTGRYFFTIGENKATKVVFVGDSYGTGYNTGGSTTGWIPGTAAALGLKSSDFENHAKGGAGFRHPANTEPYETFTDLLNLSTLAKAEVGKIVVCGGYNEQLYTVSQLLEAFETFAAKAREKYPFAEICIGMIGHSGTESEQETLMNTVRQGYMQMANRAGVRYLSNVEYVLTDDNVSSDGIHPDQAGATALGTAIGNAVKTGSASGKNYGSVIDEIDGRLVNVETDLQPLTQIFSFQRPNSGIRTLQIEVSVGDVFRITNNTDTISQIRFRDTETGENKQIVPVPANSTVLATTTVTASWIQVYFQSAGAITIEKGRVVDNENAIDSVNREVNDIADRMNNTSKTLTVTNTATGAKVIEKAVNINDVLKITNNTGSGISVRLVDANGSILQTISVLLGETIYATSTVTASKINIYFNASGEVTISTGEILSVEGIAKSALNRSLSVFNMLILEEGGISSAGAYLDRSDRVRTVNYLEGNLQVTVPDGFVVFGAFFFDKLGYILSSRTNINSQTFKLSVEDGQFCKLVFAKSDNTQSITVEEIKSSYALEDFSERINALETAPMVKFTYDHDFYTNVESIVNEKQYITNTQSMNQLYGWFDELATADPAYVTKTDIGQELGLTYPRYANGISSGDSEYLETPAYKTYMYKFACTNSGVNTALQKKKKVIILGGVHGDEQASPFNLYIFAQRLVNDYLADENIFNLRASADFYIVPCVNGYGMIHQWRLNGNGVNINRNFPIVKWSKYGEKGQDNYTGETAGSEFETQLVMALVDTVKPDLFIDHHNYTYNLNCQFYSDIFNRKQLNLSYQALADISYTLKKNLPSYFGTGFDFVKNNGGSPGATGETYGGTSRWAYEAQVPFSVTIEIGDCITYLNGVHAGTRQNYYGVDTFKVAEYTLRNQILHYLQWVLNN